MIELAAAMVQAVTMWIAATCIMTGLGYAVRRLFGLRVDGCEEALRLPWLGWGVALVVLQFWHFQFPVRGFAFCVLAVPGVAGLLWGAGDLRRAVRGSGRIGLCLGALSLGVALWMAYHSTTQANNYDSGLYQLTSVRWAYTYPVVPGLGNLHARLAFNNSYFLYVAVLDWGWFAGRSHQLAGALLLLWALGRSAAGGWRVLTDRRSCRAHHLLDFLLLVPIVRLPMFGYHFHSNPSPDLGGYLLGFVLGSELLRLLERTAAAEDMPAPRETRQTAFQFVYIVFLCAVGITVKLSFLVFAGAASLLALWAMLSSPAGSRRCAVRAILWAGAGLAMVILPWMVRGVILSGYLLFPGTHAGFPLPWRVPADVADHEAAIVRSWARKQHVPPEQVLGNWSWLREWIARMLGKPFEVVLPLGLALTLAPLLAGRGRVRSAGVGARRRTVLFLAVPCGVLLCWFWLAPEPRFAGFAFWLLGAGAVSLALQRYSRQAAAAIGLACLVLFFGQSMNVLEFLHEWQRDMGPARVGRTEIKTTQSGLRVHVPVGDNRAWDAPLPWTPYFNPQLRLRRPGELESGFILESESHPVPHPLPRERGRGPG